MVRMAAVQTPRLIGAMAFRSFLPARTTNTPMMVARMPMAGMAIGKITVLAASPLAVDRGERGHPEDDRRR